jgi:Outer membrane protein beta-barrel domain
VGGDVKTKVLMVVFAMMMLALPAMAAQQVIGIQLGFHNPKATDTGFIIGGTIGSEIDERFDISVGLDFYRKSYEETTTIAQDDGAGGLIHQEVTDVKSSVVMLPLMFHARYKIPLGSDVNVPLTPYIQGGLGYIMSWYGYENYETGADENSYFGGFGFRIALGAMYQMGSSSQFSFEFYYMSASLSHEEDDEEIGRPVKSELDMSGLGVRLGLHFGMGSI